MATLLERAALTRQQTENAAKYLPDSEAVESVKLFPAWNSSATYAVGDRVRYCDILYNCLTAHTAQADWAPTDAPSLWAKVLVSTDGTILAWEQPDSTNPYMAGDKVTHNGKTWESTVDNNVWEPGVYGWAEVTE